MANEPPVRVPPLARTVATQLRRDLSRLAKQPMSAGDFLAAARRIIRKYEPLLARAARDTTLLAYFRAAREAAKKLPPDGPPDSSPPTLFTRPKDEGPTIRLPMLDAAVADLQRRRILTPADYAVIDQDARRSAFTVARITSQQALRAVRSALVDDIQQGGTLRDFRKRVDAAIGGVLSPSQIETVYRTNAMQAYSAGQRAVLDHPMVADEFPYLEWVAIHVTRVDPTHLAMEKHGLDGTGIYRADDPIWRTHTPPIRWNCRCHLIPLSVADAAAKGVREAKRWLATGVPPTSPQWVSGPHPANPPAGWPTVASIAAVV